MVKTLSLLLPVLFPSWRFFKAVEPSPRIEWAALSAGVNHADAWRELRPRPSTIGPLETVWRLFWNPRRNEELFFVSCSERIQQKPTAHSIGVIQRAIQSDFAQAHIEVTSEFLQFRLIFIHRQDASLVREVLYLSDGFPAKPSAPS